MPYNTAAVEALGGASAPFCRFRNANGGQQLDLFLGAFSTAAPIVYAGATPVFKTGGVSVPLDHYTFDDSVGTRTGPCVFGIRPEHVAFGDPASSMPFSTDAAVEIVEPMGSDTLVWTKLGGRNFSFRVEAERTLRNGEPIRIGFDPARASLFDAATGNRM